MTTLEATPFEPFVISKFNYAPFKKEQGKRIVWYQGYVVDDGVPPFQELEGHMPSKNPRRRRRGRGNNVNTHKMVTQMLVPLRKVNGPAFPVTRSSKPGFSKVVRQLVNFNTGTAVIFAPSSIAMTDQGDYGMSSTRGWTSIRVMGIDIWGPLEKLPPSNVAAEMIIQVYIPGAFTNAIPSMLLVDQADQSSTNNRPHVHWRYGAHIAALGNDAGSVATLFAIAAASVSGEYVIDYHCVFN
jgi:hypothetical protein